MFGDGFDPLEAVVLARSAGAIFLSGWVVKLMDDFLDLRYDLFAGDETLAVRLGEGTLPYSLIGLVFAALLHPEIALSLFVGAYAAGMAGDYDRQLPSGLKGWQEGAAAVCFTLVFSPWSTVVWAVSVMLAVQITDDLFDIAEDGASGNPNIARRIGIGETRMLGLLALFAACVLKPAHTALVFMAIPLVEATCRAMAKPIVKSRGWSR